MQTKTKQTILTIVEGAVMVAMSVVLDIIFKFIPGLPWGGSISVSAVPVIFYAFRRGAGYGTVAGVVWAMTQMLTGGFYPPPANTVWSIILCLLLDYLIAFGITGIAPLFARPFGRRRLLGYTVATAAVGFLRFVSSYLSGIVLWDSYRVELWAHLPTWLYSMVYNGSYMIPNMILTALIMLPLCRAVDPMTLKPYHK